MPSLFLHQLILPCFSSLYSYLYSTALGTAKGVAIVSAPPRTVVAMLEDAANKKKEA